MTPEELLALSLEETSGNAIVRRDEDGQPHCDDAPAIYGANGGWEHWLQHGVFHRVDGPATLWRDGFHLWVVNGIPVHTWEDFQREAKCTDEEITVLQIKWGTNIGSAAEELGGEDAVDELLDHKVVYYIKK